MQVHERLIRTTLLAGLASVLALSATAQFEDVVKDVKTQESDKQKDKRKKSDAKGAFETFGAAAWSTACSKGDPLGCERDTRFAGWFPAGLVVGDKDGMDGDKKYALVMRTAAEVVIVLKSDGPSTTLDADAFAAPSKAEPGAGVPLGVGRAPAKLGGGDLARHLTAAKLNLAYNRGRSGKDEPGLGQYVVVANVAKPLIGYKVRDVIDLADKALSGAFGKVGKKKNDQRIYDADRDSTADLSLNDFKDALRTINLSFRKGSKVEGSAQARMPVAGAGASPGVKPAPGGVSGGASGASAPKAPVLPAPTDPAEPARTLITFTQAEWGKDQVDQLQNYILQEKFPKLFPRGLLIGDPQGIDGDDRFCLIFKTAKDLGDFLPAKGKPGSLAKNALNPNDSAAGSLAGELIAAKLNVLFDDRGFMPQGSGGKLGRQVYLSEVALPLRGVTVLQVLRIAERTLAGEFGVLYEPAVRGTRAIDVDGDGQGDITAMELNAALQKLNMSFQGGKPQESPFDAPDAKPGKKKGKKGGKKGKDND